MSERIITIQLSNLPPPNQQEIRNLSNSDIAFFVVILVMFSTITALIHACFYSQKQRYSKFKLPLVTLCYRCQYFSNNSYLKCALHPVTAMSEQVVDCRDYCPNSKP